MVCLKEGDGSPKTALDEEAVPSSVWATVILVAGGKREHRGVQERQG